MSETTQTVDRSELAGNNWELPEVWVRLLVAENVIPDKNAVNPSHTDEEQPTYSAWVELGTHQFQQDTYEEMRDSDLIHVVRVDIHDNGVIALCDIPRKFRPDK